MQGNLLVFIDVSGSMKEMGKHLLEMNLCRHIYQLFEYETNKYSSIDVRFYTWSESVFEIAHNEDKFNFKIVPNGIADLDVLQKYFSTFTGNIESTHILILSDGCFSDNQLSRYSTFVKDVPGLTIRAVAIGADANLERLKKLSSNKSVFLPENINSAVFSAVFGSDVRVPPPDLSQDIKICEEKEDSWDD